MISLAPYTSLFTEMETVDVLLLLFSIQRERHQLL